MKISKKILTLGLAMCSFSAAALAGGYQLNEYSVTGLGRSYAGAGVVGDDYSAIAFNPAGMQLMDSGMQFGLTTVQLRADVKDEAHSSAKNPGTIRLWPTMPHFFAQKRIDDRLNFGFGIYSPYGLATKYKRNWFASDVAVESRLDIIDFAPAVSYQVIDGLTLGGTFIARYIHGKMTNEIANYNGGGESNFDLDGWTVTGVLGAMYEFSPNTRVGLSWRMKSGQQAKGSHKIERNAFGLDGIYKGSRASPDLPNTLTLSGYHRICNIGLSGTAKWTRWSHSFEKFTLISTNPNIGAATSPYKWKDSWTVTAGLDYYYDDNWTFRVGTGYDESPSHDKYRRTVRIPDNDRIWASAGFSYKLNNWVFDVGYAHMFMKTTKVVEPRRPGVLNPTPDPVRAKYDTQSNIFGLQMQYRF